MILSLFLGFFILSLQGCDLHAFNARILNDEVVFKPRIFDGKAASITDFPYQVSIQNYAGTNHHCGGTIIDRYYVLTAAHCIDGFDPEEFRIITGTVDWTKPGSIHYVSDLIRHEQFNLDDTWNNDIGLIKVARPFIFGPTVYAARLPINNEEIPVNTRGLAIGFGRTSENSGPSKQLLKAELIIQELRYCNDMYKGHYFKDTHICTQGANNAAIYKGDSGGPFIVNGKVVGIGFTGMAKYPSVFTKISKYIDWIDSHKK